MGAVTQKLDATVDHERMTDSIAIRSAIAHQHRRREGPRLDIAIRVPVPARLWARTVQNAVNHVAAWAFEKKPVLLGLGQHTRHPVKGCLGTILEEDVVTALERPFRSHSPDRSLWHSARVIVRGSTGGIRLGAGHNQVDSLLRLGELFRQDWLRAAQIDVIRIVHHDLALPSFTRLRIVQATAIWPS